MHKIDINKEKLCFIGKIVDTSTLRKNRKNTHTHIHMHVVREIYMHTDLIYAHQAH